MNQPTDAELLKLALDCAQRALERMPRWLRTTDHLVQLQAPLYDCLIARRDEGGEIDQAALAGYEEMLVATWRESRTTYGTRTERKTV
jgi:hypothetical protein